MMWFKYYKQIHHLQKYFSCRSTLGRYIHCIYRIEPNLNFSVSSPQEILQILQVLPSSSSSLLSSFNDSAKSLHCHNGPGCCSTWGKSSLKTVSDGIFSSYTVSDGIFFSYLMVSSLPLPSRTFSALFCCKNLRVSRSLRHLCFLGKLLFKMSSRFNG